jgi:RNA polymerase sigma-70 factor (ECF subfamily)
VPDHNNSRAEDLRAFETARPVLLGLAYRILGSQADAEDAVQDTFIKWEQTEKAGIENPIAWLTTACTRRCIDLLCAAHRTRVEYVGAWLPEPIQTATMATSESDPSLGASLGTAFMLMLERLTPKERAAYLLHEIFDMTYPDIARTLQIQETTCRKLVSRARANIDQAKVRHVTPRERQEQLLAAFETALTSGSTEPLAALLSDEIELAADSGGKVPAIGRILRGKDEVLDFVLRALRRYWHTYRRTPLDLNGARGLIVHRDGLPSAAVSFAYDQAGRVTNIYIMRNPDKLSRLDRSWAG